MFVSLVIIKHVGYLGFSFLVVQDTIDGHRNATKCFPQSLVGFFFDTFQNGEISDGKIHQRVTMASCEQQKCLVKNSRAIFSPGSKKGSFVLSK